MIWPFIAVVYIFLPWQCMHKTNLEQSIKIHWMFRASVIFFILSLFCLNYIMICLEASLSLTTKLCMAPLRLVRCRLLLNASFTSMLTDLLLSQVCTHEGASAWRRCDAICSPSLPSCSSPLSVLGSSCNSSEKQKQFQAYLFTFEITMYHGHRND